jgi:YHS domain-containing protein
MCVPGKILIRLEHQWFGPLELAGWHLHGGSARRPARRAPSITTAILNRRRWRCSPMPHPPQRYRVAPGISLVVTFLGVGLSHTLSPCAEPEPIAWRDDYGAALQEAQAADRLLWVQFTGPWCPNCTRMERDSFPHRTIVQHAQESFVPLKLRCDVHEQLVQSFNISGLPATVIVAPNRDIIATYQGYLGPLEFDAFLRDSLARRPGSRRAQTSDADSSPRSARGDGTGPSNETIALSGYCAVSLVCDRKLVPGNTRFMIRHQGHVYLFATLESGERFRKEPERFVPAYDGFCPVTRVRQGTAKAGEPSWGVLYAGHLFLCATQEDRRLFLENPAQYATVELAEAGNGAPLHPRVGAPDSRRPAP